MDTVKQKSSKLQFHILAIASFAVMASIGSAATVVQIDFGTRTQLTSDTGWNNLTRTDVDTGPPNPATLTNMVDSTGAATTMDLLYSASGTAGTAGISGSGANYGGSYPTAVSGMPTSALRDGLFFNQDATVTLTFSDLNPLFTYDFLLYGARGNNGAGADFAVAGFNSDSGSISNVLNNSTETVTFTGIQPTTGGIITMTLTPDDTTSGLTSGSLNVLTITAIPEPSAALLGGLGLIALLRRRRH